MRRPGDRSAWSLITQEGFDMSRMSVFGSPLFVGFDELDQIVARQPKGGGETYPPYNIEHRRGGENGDDIIRITLAVAGFTPDQLEITLQGNRLTVTGAQADEADKTYLHRGIAARQFQRHFVLASGIEVRRAQLQNGLLTIELVRPNVESAAKRIVIDVPGENA
jgi:HSP20 family molecular chaperone IbpA